MKAISCFWQRSTLCALMFLWLTTHAFATEITALRSRHVPDRTRLVLDLDAPLKYQLSNESTPTHLIIDLENTQATNSLTLPAAVAPIKSLKLEKNGSNERLIVDTTVALSPKIFQLPPSEKYGYRLVLDLRSDKPTTSAATATPTAVTKNAPEKSTEITALCAKHAPDSVRLVLDLSAPLKYRINPASTPTRLIVDLDDAQITGPLTLPPSDGPIKSLHLEKNSSGEQLIIDSATDLSPKIFLLPPSKKYGYRLVLELYDQPTAVFFLSCDDDDD